MKTTPEELCKLIMLKARLHFGPWHPLWEHRIASKPKKKVKLYAYVSSNMLNQSNWGCSLVFALKNDLDGVIRLPELDQEIEVEDE